MADEEIPEWHADVHEMARAHPEILDAAMRVGPRFASERDGLWMALYDECVPTNPDLRSEGRFREAQGHYVSLALIVGLEVITPPEVLQMGILDEMIAGIRNKFMQYLQNLYAIDAKRAATILTDTEARIRRHLEPELPPIAPAAEGQALIPEDNPEAPPAGHAAEVAERRKERAGYLWDRKPPGGGVAP